MAVLDHTGGVMLVNNSGTMAAATATGAAAPAITGIIRFGFGSDKLDIATGSVAGELSFGAGDDRLDMSGVSIFADTGILGDGSGALALSGTVRFGRKADFTGGGQDVLTITGKGVFAGQLVECGQSGLDGHRRRRHLRSNLHHHDRFVSTG